MATLQEQLSFREIRDEFMALAKTFAPKCDLWVSLSMAVGAPALHASIRPDGLLGKTYLKADADTFGELRIAVLQVWADYAALHEANLVRSMALEIISLTADHGECADAALRGAGFDAQDVAFYGERACAQATEIAGLAPFSIVSLAGANAEAA